MWAFLHEVAMLSAVVALPGVGVSPRGSATLSRRSSVILGSNAISHKLDGQDEWLWLLLPAAASGDLAATAMPKGQAKPKMLHGLA